MQLRARLQNIWNHSGFQKYFRNTGWMFVGQMTMIISLFLNIWIARALGPTHFGSLSYIFAFTGMFAFIANLGIQDILVRDIVKNPSETKNIASTVARVLFMSGCIAFLMSGIASLVINGLTLITILIILYSTIFLFTPIVTVIPAYFQATVQAKQNAITQIVGTIIVSIIKGYLIFSGKGIIWLTGTFVMDYAVGAILYIFIYTKLKLSFIDLKIFDINIAYTFLKSSIPLIATSAFSYALFKIDQVLIKNLIDETALGLYAAARKLTEIWYFIPGIISASLFPALIHAKTINKITYSKRIRNLIFLLVIISAVIALLTSSLAPWIIPLFFSVAYSEAILVTQIYAWSLIGYTLIIITNKYLTSENHLTDMMIYTGIAGILNIMLAFVLIPNYGIIGVAVANIISYMVMPILVFVRKRNTSKITEKTP